MGLGLRVLFIMTLLFGGLVAVGAIDLPTDISVSDRDGTPRDPDDRRDDTADSREETNSKDALVNATADELEVADATHETVNAVRADRGLTTLSQSQQLQVMAQYHSNDMAARGYVGHTSPTGETMRDRYQQFEPGCREQGENVFHLSYSGLSLGPEELADRAVEGWLNSPTHRENLLRKGWSQEGIGVNITTAGWQTHVYITQNFCG